MPTELPVSPLPGLHTIELTPDRAPLLQRFFDDNPAYFLATSGVPPGPGEALEEITEDLPAGMRFTKKWVVGYVGERGALVAMANVITDLLAPGIFHIGTFIVATDRHGSGLAQQLHRGLEQWSAANGAAWMRLGVVQGHARAERFWAAEGYRPVRVRPGIQMGPRVVTVRTMVKPLAGGDLEDYFALAPRDRPEAASGSGVLEPLQQAYADAVLRKDAAALLALYADDVRIFDAWETFEVRGKPAWAASVEGWLSGLGSESVRVRFEDTTQHAGDALATLGAVVTYTALDAQGAELRRMQNRISWVAARIGDRWRIVAEHTSAPIAFAGMKAILQRGPA